MSNNHPIPIPATSFIPLQNAQNEGLDSIVNNAFTIQKNTSDPRIRLLLQIYLKKSKN